MVVEILQNKEISRGGKMLCYPSEKSEYKKHKH